VEGLVIALNESGALEKIEGKIAAHTELGEDGEIGATALGFRCEGQDARGVAIEIADRGIELGEGYDHAG